MSKNCHSSFQGQDQGLDLRGRSHNIGIGDYVMQRGMEQVITTIDVNQQITRVIWCHNAVSLITLNWDVSKTYQSSDAVTVES